MLRVLAALVVALLSLSASAQVWVQLGTGGGGGGGGDPTIGWRLTVDKEATSATTPTAIPEWTWTAAASTKYWVRCLMITSAELNTTGVQLAYNGPASPALFIVTRGFFSGNSQQTFTVTEYITDTITSSAGTSPRLEYMEMVIETTGGGDFTIGVVSEVEGSWARVHAGSSCERKAF